MIISYDDYLKLRGLLTLADDHRRSMEQIEGSVKRLLQTDSDIVSDEVWGFHRGPDDLLKRLEIRVASPVPDFTKERTGAFCAQCGQHITLNGDTWEHDGPAQPRHTAIPRDDDTPHSATPGPASMGVAGPNICAVCGESIVYYNNTWYHFTDGPKGGAHADTPKE